MKLGVAQHNAKCTQLNFDPFMFTIWILMMQFAEKESFHLAVLNNLRNIPWIELITCANFSLETGLYSES